MNIFFRELKSNLKSLLIWGVIVMLFVTIGFSKFSAYYENPELLAILDNMPAAMLEAFNLSAFNLTTITGFYGVMFSYFGLLLSIASVMWGSDIISKEERDKTVEFSLTLPVTRGKLVMSKAAAATINCIALLVITYLATIVNAQQYQPDEQFYQFLNLGTVSLFIMQLIFLAVGLLIGASMKQHKRSSSVAVSLLLGTYFISIISGLYKDLDFLKYLSPFKYFNPATLLHDAQIDFNYVWLSLGIVVLSVVGSYFSYQRRDLYI